MMIYVPEIFILEVISIEIPFGVSADLFYSTSLKLKKKKQRI